VSHNRHVGDGVYDPRVYVYKRTRAGWTHRQTIGLASGCEGGLGHLSLEGGTAMLGSCVFERDSDGQYELAGQLTTQEGLPVSGTLSAEGRAIVGGSAAANGGAGAVWVFQRRGSRWLQLTELASPTGAVDTGFGSAVSQSGRYLAVGAQTTPLPEERRRGVVHLYVRRGNDFELAQTIENPLPPDGDLRDFGANLALEGDRLLVGSLSWYYGGPWHTPSQPTVYLYQRDGAAFSAAAVLNALWSNSVFLSDRYALVGATSFTGGTFPAVFELPSTCH
jgi:hypothetical protein